MSYNNYSVIDFVMDEYFQQWVLHPDEKTNAYWYQWLKDHPDKYHEVKEARKLILLQRFKSSAVPTGRLAEIRENIKKNVDSRSAIPVGKNPEKPLRSWRWLSVAATVAILFLTGITLYFLNYDYPRTVATGYGQIKEIMLSDSSRVILNANSLMEYADNWTQSQRREVWLHGEAFFEVARLDARQASRQDTALTKFIVHVDGLDVEVVGTQFNVNNRNGAVKVVLNEGKVRIRVKDGKQMDMVPGEMLTYSAQSQNLLKKLVDPAKHISWRNHHLIFDGQQLQEIASILETNYGVQVIFTDPTLSKKKITGILPSDNLDVILEALRTIYGIRIKKEGNDIIFQD